MSPEVPATLPAAAARAAQRFANKPALLENGRMLDFAQLYRQARSAAAAFLARGVKHGDRIAIWAPNRREWIVAALGAQMAGAAIVPINTRLKGREAGDILRRSRARLLICAGRFLDIDYPQLIAAEHLPLLQWRIILDAPGPDGWDAFIASGPGPEDPAVDAAIAALTADDISDIIFTSGTTGLPKGVLSTHGQLIRLFINWAAAVDLRPEDRYLIANPFFHTFGYKAGWACCLCIGATMLPIPVFDASATAGLIEQERVSFIPGPPTLFQSLLADNAAHKRDFTSLRVAVTGASTVPPILIERMRRELGIQAVITGYGMTECGAITMCRAGDSVERIAHTCGRVLPGLELKIVGEDGNELPPTHAGEILVRGFGVMKGYLDDPAATAEAIDSAGWLHTGDVGVLDSTGYLTITDRKKDMYICGGFNCYPAEIEKLLCEHEAVEAAAVVGIPDERLGEVGKAFVVPRPGRQIEAASLLAWARANMANYKVPRAIEVRAELPKNAAGKVLRTELRRY